MDPPNLAPIQLFPRAHSGNLTDFNVNKLFALLFLCCAVALRDSRIPYLGTPAPLAGSN